MIDLLWCLTYLFCCPFYYHRNKDDNDLYAIYIYDSTKKLFIHFQKYSEAELDQLPLIFVLFVAWDLENVNITDNFQDEEWKYENDDNDEDDNDMVSHHCLA